MGAGSIAAALIKEHHDIDAGIEGFVSRVEDISEAPNPEQVEEAAAALLTAFAALRRHIYLEEEFIFPSLSDPSVAMALMVMYREHGQIWRLMDQAEAQISTENAQETVLKTCKSMLAELERHNAKEEPIIYPHTDADLSLEEQKRLENFLDTGKMPEGWTCREAVQTASRNLPF